MPCCRSADAILNCDDAPEPGCVARNQSRERREFGELERLEADLELLQFARERGLVDQRRRAVDRVRRDALQFVQMDLQSRGDAAAAAFVFEQMLRDGPALVLFADAIGHRHAHVVEEHLIHFVIAGERDDRLHAHAGLIHLEQQKRNALLRPALGARAHETEDVIGEMRVRGPDLRAVHDVVVAVAHGARLQTREVRTRSRFRIALAPVVFAGEHLRQIAGFLFFARISEQRRRQQIRALIQHARRTGARAFLAEDEQLRRRPAGAAVLRRPMHRAPAAAIELLLPDTRDRAVDEHAGCAPTCIDQLVGQLGFQECANLAAESFVVGAEPDVERHCDSRWGCGATSDDRGSFRDQW